MIDMNPYVEAVGRRAQTGDSKAMNRGQEIFTHKLNSARLEKCDKIAEAFGFALEEQKSYAREVIADLEEDPGFQDDAQKIRDHYQL